MSKDLELKKETGIQVVEDSELLLDVDMQEIKPDYVSVCQSQTFSNLNGAVPLGSVFLSGDKTVVAKKEEEFEMVFFNYIKYIKETNSADKTKFRIIDAKSAEGIDIIQNRKFADIVNGVTFKRDVVYKFLGVLVNDLKQEFVIPSYISFSGTARRTGENIASMLNKASAVMKQPPIRYAFALHSVQKENNEGQKWFILNNTTSRKTTDAEYAKSKEILISVKNHKIEQDEAVAEHNETQEVLQNARPARIDDMDF